MQAHSKARLRTASSAVSKAGNSGGARHSNFIYAERGHILKWVP
jgi:hypothetical protein